MDYSSLSGLLNKKSDLNKEIRSFTPVDCVTDPEGFISRVPNAQQSVEDGTLGCSGHSV